MRYEITTKQGTKYIVSDEDIEIWIDLEEILGITYNEAASLMQKGSMKTISEMLFIASKLGGHTELKTSKAWRATEYETVEVLDEDPKAPPAKP
jgi:hypothetical protein